MAGGYMVCSVGIRGAGGLLLPLFLVFLTGCHSVQQDFSDAVNREYATRPPIVPSILSEGDVARMPAPVRKYLAFTGALGRPKPVSMRLVFDEMMYRKPGSQGMVSTSEQYNFYGRFARFFYMKSQLLMIPFRILHAYSSERATMHVRVAGLFDAVNLSGKDLTMAETVTVLNDLCLFAPGALADPRITWQALDDVSARVFFENGPYRVSAVLHFAPTGELINFVSEDRLALQDDGSLRKAKWSTPVSQYRLIEGRRIPFYGEAIWHYPEGDYVYGRFWLKDIQYNVDRVGD